ncbi:xanthine dehydrogenase family protein molybdopterin-binding subunit [Pseudaestuariivita atlantica]|uniref:Xanthine dehydrogenase n=1 Tax=Pseudaestuariivita atlantica TaxID=1317121 RepID=A0A0L1JRM4_9RHOB|nr:xanthine dehydrogenase family protein molybdopterin-binding subunit [Pseudaestuariivita atlantica]KNG94038.1 xanthine dehydrogenase [Pseudaestuariivita atlantica]
MEKFGRSQPITRIEDVRFLTGHGRYVDDIAPAHAFHAFVFRSPVAHATITELDLSDAREAEGVHMVFSADDMEAAGLTLGMDGTTVKNIDGSTGASPLRAELARDRVRFVGEPVAVVVADTLAQARDAAELIVFEYDELPVSLSLDFNGPTIHPEAPDNRAFDWGMGDADATDAAFAKAARTVSMDVGDNRVIVNAMEGRGVWAEWDGTRLHLCVNGQGVWGTKSKLAAKFDLAADNVRVTNPDVGGGFGMKAMEHPENVCIAFAAMQLDHPVRWMSDRSEGMLSDNAGRDLVHTAEMAFDADNRITAYRVHTICNLGAYNSQFAQPIQTQLFSRVLTSVYDIPATWLHVEGVYTNTTQVDAYRGAGRPEAIYLMERLMDQAARELGVDPWELRRKNFIRADQFPYDTLVGETYDVGDFHRVLAAAEAQADRPGFAARRAASEARGRLRGLGLCYYIESILGDPSESARVEFAEDGMVDLFVGTQSNGQGHETVYTMFLHDQTGIPPEKIRVVQGDSDRIKQGGGTGGSRSVTVQNTATLAAVDTIVAAFTPFVAELAGVDAENVSFDHETFRAEGSNVVLTMLDVAEKAREAGRDDLLQHEARTKLDARSFPNGAHVAEVEVDPATGVVTLCKYTVVDDFGNLINPMLVEGQVHGGVVQGVGQALTEHVIYDEEGQLLTASFMDYAMPRADLMPMIGFTTEPVPSTANIMGMKGCGEAGTVGSMAATANAVHDALWARGVAKADMPFTPLRVWEMLQDAQGIAAE